MPHSIKKAIKQVFGLVFMLRAALQKTLVALFDMHFFFYKFSSNEIIYKHNLLAPQWLEQS